MNYVISQILITLDQTFEPQTPAGHPNHQKTLTVA